MSLGAGRRDPFSALAPYKGSAPVDVLAPKLSLIAVKPSEADKRMLEQLYLQTRRRLGSKITMSAILRACLREAFERGGLKDESVIGAIQATGGKKAGSQ